MEDLNQPLDAGLGADATDEGLKITDDIRQYWQQTANWALFLAVLMFIGLGFMLLGMFFGGLMSVNSGTTEGVIFVGLLFLYAALLFFPAWYYYKFSTLTKQAVSTGDNNALEDGFDYLKRFYRFIGILVIVIIALYVFFLIFGMALLANMNNL